MISDYWVAQLLVPLAIWVLINGIDDLIVDVAALYGYFCQRFSSDPNWHVPDEAELDAAPPRLIAVFVPNWREHRVIRKMLDNNVARLRYPSVEFFIGAYPNDAPTLAAVREAMNHFPNLHLAVCPHNGPTSKADCLNWIYQRMLLYEEENHVRFEMVVTHDAEDAMDPDALRWLNYFAQWNDFVQIPVLGLPRTAPYLVGNLYCDEFAEYQFRDMIARQTLGGFIPSTGVGTGYSRRALEALAEEHANRIFEPGCLTEDYENGWRVQSLGLRQKFIPIVMRGGRPVATREYFPHGPAAAIAQRSRWVTGITLQSWELHSWRETLGHAWWFWRDRKSVVSNLVTPLTNVIFFYGAVTWGWADVTHQSWGLAQEASAVSLACAVGLGLQTVHTSVRMCLCARVYGAPFALLVPLRILVANFINFRATSRAIRSYALAKMRGQPLRWVKTEHAYPTRSALVPARQRIGEILTAARWLTDAQLESALATKPHDRRLGEHLIELGLIDEHALYRALSRQHDLPLGKPETESISVAVTRALPAAVVRRWRALPYRITAGELYLAGADLPGEEMRADIRRFSSLEIRFQLVTPTEFEEMAARYLGTREDEAAMGVGG